MRSMAQLYNQLRNDSKGKTLRQLSVETFQDAVKKDLESRLTKMYGDDYDLTVVYPVDDFKETKRDISADYSVDINADDIEFDCFGKAVLNELGRYTCMMKAYRNAERGDTHDYIDTVEISTYKSRDFVVKFSDRIIELFKEALEEVE